MQACQITKKFILRIHVQPLALIGCPTVHPIQLTVLQIIFRTEVKAQFYVLEQKQ